MNSSLPKPVSPLLSVIVPCYNEAAGIGEIYSRLTEACKAYAQAGYQIIFIDDGSEDTTWSCIETLHARDARVAGICFSRNFGHSMALTAGLDKCSGERVLIIDADLQDPPELLPAMMQKMDEGADVVYGQRIRRSGESWLKRVSAHFFYRLFNQFSDIAVPADTGDFRLINRKVLEVLRRMPETARYTRGMVAWAGFRQVAFPYERQERFAGATHYTLEKMLKFALDALTGFSIRPLRLAFYMGFFMLFVSMMLLGYIITAYVEHHTVRGWASIAFLIVGTQSVQWVLLGLIGEYIGRIYQESKQRPKYVVMRETEN